MFKQHVKVNFAYDDPFKQVVNIIENAANRN